MDGIFSFFTFLRLPIRRYTLPWRSPSSLHLPYIKTLLRFFMRHLCSSRNFMPRKSPDRMSFRISSSLYSTYPINLNLTRIFIVTTWLRVTWFFSLVHFSLMYSWQRKTSRIVRTSNGNKTLPSISVPSWYYIQGNSLRHRSASV